MFSVALSALFYFKQPTNNAFYDNTYKFSKDIAELLVRIESDSGNASGILTRGIQACVIECLGISKATVADTKKE